MKIKDYEANNHSKVGLALSKSKLDFLKLTFKNKWPYQFDELKIRASLDEKQTAVR